MRCGQDAPIKTKCSSARTGGREFLPDARQKIAENCVHHPQVQIYFGDGLCSPSIKANIPDLFPTIKMGLEDKGITVGTPFFVRYCRVNTARTIGPLLDAEVTCVLIGERPGLLTSESMSAYMPTMRDRTCLSRSIRLYRISAGTVCRRWRRPHILRI